jgi:uncharacterized protein YdcH (DUF465 family)
MHREPPVDKQQLFARLSAEHRALATRVRELEAHVSLSPAEKVEIARLKKLKLRAKDRLERLRFD